MDLFDLLPISIDSHILLLSIIALILYYIYSKHNYWKNRGVACGSTLRLWLQLFGILIGKIPFWEWARDQYNALPQHKFCGTFTYGRPTLLIRDPELIKVCLVKSFSSLHDRCSEPDPVYDQLSSNLFQMVGEKWHQVRQKVAPAFSPLKLRIMYQTLKECARELDLYMQSMCAETGETEICVKYLMTNYTMDVIGACAMGIKCNAIQDPECQFKKIVDQMMCYDLRRNVYFLLEIISPKLPRLLRFKAIHKEVEEFFRSVVRDTMEMKKRDANRASARKDFLQILMNLRDCEQAATAECSTGALEADGALFCEDILVGMMSVFLSAGFEPVACTVTFCLYELARHPEIQQKLHEEIKLVTGGNIADINYDDLRKLSYMEQVIDETLRKYPVFPCIERICNERFILPETSLVIEEGTIFFVPTISLHHDPRFFPNPDEFDPNRFAEQNIDKIIPGSYLPFGDGPRCCIASRMAIMMIKTMLTTMILSYNISPCALTPERIEFDRSRYALSPPKAGLMLRIQKRKS
nr:PREDICTED: probable cytochrome P450 6a13 [Bemisia tabaci]